MNLKLALTDPIIILGIAVVVLLISKVLQAANVSIANIFFTMSIFLGIYGGSMTVLYGQETIENEHKVKGVLFILLGFIIALICFIPLLKNIV